MNKTIEYYSGNYYISKKFTEKEFNKLKKENCMFHDIYNKQYIDYKSIIDTMNDVNVYDNGIDIAIIF